MINRIHAMLHRPERGWDFVLVRFVRPRCSRSIGNLFNHFWQLISHTKQNRAEALTTRMGAAP